MYGVLSENCAICGVLQKQIEYYNHMVYEILTNEIGLILPTFTKDKDPKVVLYLQSRYFDRASRHNTTSCRERIFAGKLNQWLELYLH